MALRLQGAPSVFFPWQGRLLELMFSSSRAQAARRAALAAIGGRPRPRWVVGSLFFRAFFGEGRVVRSGDGAHFGAALVAEEGRGGGGRGRGGGVGVAAARRFRSDAGAPTEGGGGTGDAEERRLVRWEAREAEDAGAAAALLGAGERTGASNAAAAVFAATFLDPGERLEIKRETAGNMTTTAPFCLWVRVGGGWGWFWMGLWCLGGRDRCRSPKTFRWRTRGTAPFRPLFWDTRGLFLCHVFTFSCKQRVHNCAHALVGWFRRCCPKKKWRAEWKKNKIRVAFADVRAPFPPHHHTRKEHRESSKVKQGSSGGSISFPFFFVLNCNALRGTLSS